MQTWYNELKKNVDCPIVFAGNKSDLSHNRTVPSAKAEEYAEERGVCCLASS